MVGVGMILVDLDLQGSLYRIGVKVVRSNESLNMMPTGVQKTNDLASYKIPSSEISSLCVSKYNSSIQP